ncbi:MAG: efflux RND transporter periplasmic adaptor subunit [Desulfosudaceae bacterium]
MKKQAIWITTVIIGVIAAAGILFFLKGYFGTASEKTPPDKQKPPPLVRVLAATQSDISKVLELTGSVEPYRVARLASPAEGPVTDVHVREADRAAAGQPLLTIGREEGVEALIASLREALKKEENNLNRTRRLVADQALPDEQLDQAKAAYENARALLVRARETARDHIIKAPWAGVVSRVNAKQGEFVAPRTVLLEMYDPDSLVIRAAVPEKHATVVAIDMPVAIRLDAYPDTVIPGRIERVYPYLDARLRTRTVEITLDKAVTLMPGMFARLELSLSQAQAVVVVPRPALVRTPQGPVVFVAADGKAAARPVKTGIATDNRVEIISGIQLGDKVIVAGNEALKNGADIRVEADSQPDREKEEVPAAPTAGQPGQDGGKR